MQPVTQAELELLLRKMSAIAEAVGIRWVAVGWPRLLESLVKVTG
jgi:hypothetical protein